MSEIKIQPLPADSGLVPVTREEALAWMVAWGRVTTVERGGQLYRVLEVGEVGTRPRNAPETIAIGVNETGISGAG